MYVNVRLFDSDTSIRVRCRSVKDSIRELKAAIVNELSVGDPGIVRISPRDIRLMFAGREVSSITLTNTHMILLLSHQIPYRTRLFVSLCVCLLLRLSFTCC